ncbi:Tat pathway signal protein [Allorhizocola rhizosphaerae]|uniref:Tat pathway signal protein n=1 Tax=Allorhizocola rhizosphaerae TaxID=1872709 RepID=UPI000E3C823C|nr:Tat pathway signal protein [Allorhizocola rhizosphaerae]
MTRKRGVNTKLAAVIAEAGLSHAQVARAVVRVAAENGAREHAAIGRSHVSHWVAGSSPSDQAPFFLAEALSRQLKRVVTLDEIGLSQPASTVEAFDWGTDTLIELVDLGRMDIDVNRRTALGAATFSAAALILPEGDWWRDLPIRGRHRNPKHSRVIGAGDVEAVREMTQIFSKLDQRRGGGHARSALIQYLSSDVASNLTSTFATERIRQQMFSAASELAYLAGWTAFDNDEHAIAQHHFRAAVKLAAEANDAPMAGHVLRAMAHQAVDLGHVKAGLDLATASLDAHRYQRACPRERALLGVVYAKALGANGHKASAAAALLRAEDDLAAASPGDDEPSRVFFFGEASLAHETACTLRDTGDLAGSIREFRRSVRTRKASSFTRTHAVTLGYLGSVQAQSRHIEQACATWSKALDAMDGINSGRTRKVLKDMRTALSPFRKRGLAQANELDARAADYLATTR